MAPKTVLGERISSIESKLNSLSGKLEVLTHRVASIDFDGLEARCLSIVSESKVQMNAVIDLNGRSIKEKLSAVNQESTKAMALAVGAMDTLKNKLEPIEKALLKFDELEESMTATYEKRMTLLERSIRSAMAVQTEVETYTYDISKLQKAVAELKVKARGYDDHLRSILMGLRGVEARANTMETNAAVSETQRVYDGSGALRERLDHVADELSMLAYNCVSSGVGRSGVTECPIDRARAAAKLLRRRAESCPPVPRRNNHPTHGH